jgi:hypothetical protein
MVAELTGGAISGAVAAAVIALVGTVFNVLITRRTRLKVQKQQAALQTRLQDKQSDLQKELVQRQQEFEREIKERELKHEQEREQEETFFDSLHWFEGKTQKRSIGITALEAYRSEEDLPKDLKYARYRDLSIPLLISQAIYLLASSGEDSREDELNNLRRITKLLMKVEQLEQQEKEKLIKKYQDDYKRLQDVVEKKAKGQITSGLKIPFDAEDLGKKLAELFEIAKEGSPRQKPSGRGLASQT